MTTCIALLRGVNVGRANRIAMADLRAVVESLGHAKVRTLLNSGNVVFDAAGAGGRIAASIEGALGKRFGLSAPVIVVTAAELTAIVRASPFAHATKEPSRYLIAVAPSAAALAGAQPLLAQRWAREAIALENRAAYLWCAAGLIESKLWKAFERATAGAATTRNWATILKLQAAAAAGKLPAR